MSRLYVQGGVVAGSIEPPARVCSSWPDAWVGFARMGDRTITAARPAPVAPSQAPFGVLGPLADLVGESASPRMFGSERIGSETIAAVSPRSVRIRLRSNRERRFEDPGRTGVCSPDDPFDALPGRGCEGLPPADGSFLPPVTPRCRIDRTIGQADLFCHRVLTDPSCPILECWVSPRLDCANSVQFLECEPSNCAVSWPVV